MSNYSTSNLVSVATNLHDAWADWLRKFEPYDWFSTLTFKENINVTTADTQYHRWIRQINEFAFGRRYKEKGQGITHIRAIEYQKRGVVHFHVLIGNLPFNLNRKAFEQVWETQHSNNGFANTYSYDPQLGAVGYLGKYITKGGQIDVYLPPWRYERVIHKNLKLAFMPEHEI